MKVTAVQTTTRDTARDSRQRTRVYFWPQNETVFDNIVNRHFRPVRLYRKHIPYVLMQVGAPDGTRAAWSQRAGCSCPCSPGFILDVNLGYDINVTVEYEESDVNA